MASKSKYVDLIDTLKDINKNNVLPVYVPSIGREVDFNPITVHQQKRIISTALESSLNTMSFSVIASNIVKDCCAEENLTIYSLDRDAILIGLRTHMLGYDITGQTSIGEERPVNIEDHYKLFSSHKAPKTLLSSKILKYNDINITFKPPTLDTDMIVCKRARTVVDKIIKDTGLADTIGEVIVYELVKYVKRIEVNDKTLDFNYTDALQLVKVLEQLPLKLSKMILTEVNRIKRFEDKFSVIQSPSENISIVVDARFFNGE